ncbi:mechanosensitive ion channel [bacterium]|nr:mechanosensitive ion channel [bacterium]
MASKNMFCQILGALFKPSAISVIGWFLLLCLGVVACFQFAGLQIFGNLIELPCKLYIFGGVTIAALLAISACSTLTDVFSLLKKEVELTRCQIAILVVIGLWIISFLLIFDIRQDTTYYLALLVLGSMVGWIFKDILRGVTAFVHLRINHLLNIGDWVQVPKYNVDGEVRRVTLTTVTILNWDTTTSSLPIAALHTEHFVNMQRMAEGKTYGRQMVKTFYINNKYIHSLSAQEADSLRKKLILNDAPHYLQECDIQEGALNIRLFRLYIYHWLMNHPDVSQKPWVLARWMDPGEHGTPLQIYIYLTKSNLSAYEWSQSQIIEHIISSLDLFGLELFQSS